MDPYSQANSTKKGTWETCGFTLGSLNYDYQKYRQFNYAVN